ncbi:unnamed protein product [Sphagnum balticum]
MSPFARTAHIFLKSKFLPNDSFDKLKARLVAGGNWQIEGTYGHTASPTVNPITVNTLINIMTVYDLACEAIDINGTTVLPSNKQQYVKLVLEVAQFWIRSYSEHRKYLHRDGYIYMRRTAVLQQKYLDDIMAKYADLFGRDGSTPMELAFLNQQEVSEICNVHDYLSIVMTLMYLARYTRPDILFATTQADMDAELKIVAYLRTTGVLAFVYSGSELSVQVYADASHGVHPDGGGHSCIIITLGSATIATRSVNAPLYRRLSDRRDRGRHLCPLAPCPPR